METSRVDREEQEMETPMSATGRARLPETAEFAAALARRAGAHALRSFRRPMDVEVKGDESPVTIADHEVEQLMRDAIQARFPDHGVFGEEFGQVGMDAECIWVVDPIDGTRSFITGWPIWGTLLALSRSGTPDIGVIEMPALSERWIGTRTQGTRFEESDGTCRTARVSGCTQLAHARFYTTSLLFFEGRTRARVEAIAQAVHTPRFGGDCYIYGLLASGHIDLIIENRLQPYDFMATVPVIEGAGGVITDWAGQPLGLDSGGEVIAASTPELHARALEMLHA